jgi:hypothetical protein
VDRAQLVAQVMADGHLTCAPISATAQAQTLAPISKDIDNYENEFKIFNDFFIHNNSIKHICTDI